MHEADLLKPSSFDAAVAGCDYLFHVASPFQFAVEDNIKDLIAPAVDGTRNVLASAIKHKASIKRVVITSSVCGASP